MTCTALLFGAFELLWRVTGAPSSTNDAARLDKLAASQQPEGCNGWPLVLEAALKAERAEEEVEQRWYDSDPNSMPWLQILLESGPPMQGWEAALEVLEAIKQSGAFEMLAEAAKCPQMVRPNDMSPPSGDVTPILRLVRACAVSMRLAADRNETEAVVSAFEQGLAASRAAASQPFAIYRLVGLANESLMLAELRKELRERTFDESTCRALLEAMDRQAWPTSVTLALEGERALVLRTIGSTFSDDGHGDGAIVRERLEEIQTGMEMVLTAPSDIPPIVASAIHVSRAETTAIVNEYYDRVMAASKRSAAQRFAAGPALTDPPQFGWRHAVLEVTLAGFGGMLDREDRGMTDREHARITIALEAFHARHGCYPASLDTLTGELLPAVPADPLSGGPFAYRLTRPESPVPYLLYSIGADGIDDSAALTAPPERGAMTGDEWLNDVRQEPMDAYE